LAGAWLDAAVALDSSVSQQPDIGAAFAPRAPRLRGGLPANLGGSLSVVHSERAHSLGDATYGLRVSRRWGGLEVSALGLSGPEPEPTLTLEGSGSQIVLIHPRRSVAGVTAEGQFGAAVWRLEAAHIPDQPVNTLGPAVLSHDDRARTLVGVGVDWNAPFNVFANGQIIVDEIEGGRSPAARPLRDVFATVRLQRGFANDTLRLRIEALGAISDGDAVVRPQLDWQANDRWSAAVGADVFVGDRSGLFGQYRDESRLWLRLRSRH
jgi:hypothetical protein